MMDFEPELLDRNPEWRLVLESYRQLQDRTIRDEDDAPAWLPRLRSVPGVVSEHLSAIHGKLIALGLLQFELAGRTEGVCYRVSDAGKRALSGVARCAVAEEDSEDWAQAQSA